MFSNLASYLLGYSVQPTTAEEGGLTQAASTSSPLRLSAVEVDEDDWLLVNASEVEEGDENSLFVRSRSPLNSSSRNSRSGSVSSLPCLSMEESWFVTPPPCFTSSGPIVIETSSLENLLIEHPSMSVYHHRSPPMTPRLPRARSTSPRPSEPIVQPPVQPLRPNNRRQPIQTLHQQQHLHCLELKAAHKYQKRQSLKVNRNQLERRNKVKEVNSGNRRQRRSDRQQQHSGVNNNRKCC